MDALPSSSLSTWPSSPSNALHILMPARPWSALHASSAEQADRFQRQGASGDATHHADGSVSISPTFWDSRLGRFVKRAGALTGVTTIAAPLLGALTNYGQDYLVNGVPERYPSMREMAGAGLLTGLGLSAVGALFIPFMKPQDRFAKERYEKEHQTKLFPTSQGGVYTPIPELAPGESLVIPPQAGTLATRSPAPTMLEGSAPLSAVAPPQVIGGGTTLPSAYVVNAPPAYGVGEGGFGGRGGFWDGAGDYLLYSTIFDGLGGRGRYGYGGYGDTVIKNKHHHHYYNGAGEHIGSIRGRASSNPFHVTTAPSRPAKRSWFGRTPGRSSRSWFGSSRSSSRSSRK